MTGQKLISDHDLAVRWGYKLDSAGFRSVRAFLKTRDVMPVDERRPAMYDEELAMRARAERPPRRGNRTTGPAKRIQVEKAKATYRRNRAARLAAAAAAAEEQQ